MREEIINEIKRYFCDSRNIVRSCFVYDLKDIATKCFALSQSITPHAKIFYAMKANPHEELLRCIRSHKEIFGVDVSSSGELEKALKYWPSQRIIFTGPGKHNNDLALAIRSHIGLIVVESITEAHRISQIAAGLNQTQDIILRVNTSPKVEGAHLLMSGFSSKFGIDEELIHEAVDMLTSLPFVNFRGIHCYAASGILDYQEILQQSEHVLSLAEKLICKRVPIDFIDLGGGFGIDYTESGRSLDLVSLANGIRQIKNSSTFANIDLAFELGRYIVGDSGYYCSEVIDIKESRGKKHVIVAGGMNHQRRPVATDTVHKVSTITRNCAQIWDGEISVNDEKVDIDGPLCLEPDRLAWGVHIEEVRIGDIVVIHRSGAYGASMGATNFICHPAAKEIFVH